MSNLASALANPPALVAKKCIVQQWIDGLEEEDQRAVKAAMLDIRWSGPELHSELKGAGLFCGITAVRSHRNGRCTCEHAR